MINIINYLNRYNICLSEDSGREIAREKDAFYDHTGVIMGTDRRSGEVIVFHNHNSSGPSLVTLFEFSQNKHTWYTNKDSDSYDVVMYRSFQQLEKYIPYSAITHNCQHSSSYSRKGVYESEGVAKTIGVLAFVAILSAFASSDSSKNR